MEATPTRFRPDSPLYMALLIVAAGLGCWVGLAADQTSSRLLGGAVALGCAFALLIGRMTTIDVGPGVVVWRQLWRSEVFRREDSSWRVELQGSGLHGGGLASVMTLAREGKDRCELRDWPWRSQTWGELAECLSEELPVVNRFGTGDEQ